MKKFSLSTIFVLSLIFSNISFAKTFNIDAAHSSIEFSIKHLGIVPVKGSFKKFSGSFEIDEKTGKAKNLSVKIDVDSIYTNQDDRDAHLKSKDFFNVRNDVYDIVEKNRYITFKAAKFSTGDRKISGKLKILKTTKKIKLKSKIKPLKVEGKIMRVGFEATGEIDRQDFGLSWQKPATGLLAKAAGKFVGDDVELIINVSAEAKK